MCLPERKDRFLRFVESKGFELAMDTRLAGWRISPQLASERFNESFLAIARNNAGVWLPIDPHMFLTLRADEETTHQYTYRGFVQGGHWHSLPNEYVRHFFTTELLRRCKASCGKPISCSDAGLAAPGGGEASDADVATAESAVVGPPIAYPQHENDYCVAYSAASGLHAAGDADSAASVARLAPQIVGLPAGNDRVQWLTHHSAQQLQPHWETRKLKSVGQHDAAAFLAQLSAAAAAGTVTVFQIQDSAGNVQHCAAAAAGWLFDPNQAHALPLSAAGLDACCLGGARFASVVKGFEMRRGAAGTKRAAPDGEGAPAAKRLRRCACCGEEKLNDQFSKTQLKAKKDQARCSVCARGA